MFISSALSSSVFSSFFGGVSEEGREIAVLGGGGREEGCVWRRVGSVRPPGLHGNFIVCVFGGGIGDKVVEELKVIVEGVPTWFRGEMKK